LNQTLVKEFILAKDLATKAEEQAKEYRARAEELEAKLLAEFTEDGLQNFKTAEGVTVYLKRNYRVGAQGGDAAALCEALKAGGYGDIVKENVNNRTLLGWALEYLKAGVPIPPEVAPYLKVIEDWSVNVSRSR
jgi:NAD(P)H-dependent flavin oxidoreductase YrpB (nitropropane dioxygenase family)